MMTDRPTPQRFITLGSGRRLTLREYVQVWRLVKEIRAAGGTTTPCDLVHPYDHNNRIPIQQALAQFRDALHERIDRRGGIDHRGRKHDPDRTPVPSNRERHRRDAK